MRFKARVGCKCECDTNSVEKCVKNVTTLSLNSTVTVCVCTCVYNIIHMHVCAHIRVYNIATCALVYNYVC